MNHRCINQVVKGFVPVDEFGNPVKNVPRAPEIKIEGMPLTNRERSDLLRVLHAAVRTCIFWW